MSRQLWFKIGEAAKEAGVTPRDIRYWEKHIPEIRPRRSKGNLRYYHLEDLPKLRSIAHWVKNQHFTVADCRELLQRGCVTQDLGLEIENLNIDIDMTGHAKHAGHAEHAGHAGHAETAEHTEQTEHMGHTKTSEELGILDAESNALGRTQTIPDETIPNLFGDQSAIITATTIMTTATPTPTATDQISAQPHQLHEVIDSLQKLLHRLNTVPNDGG